MITHDKIMYMISLGGRKFIRSSCDIDRNTHYSESEPQTVWPYRME